MVKRRSPDPAIAVLALVALAVTGCSGNAGSDTSGPEDAAAELTSEQGADETGVAEDGPAAPSTANDADGDGATTVPTAPPTTLRPGVVARDGSVEDVLFGLEEASNFAGGVEDWLAAVPGQEGVLRNSAGITLFVPVDEGFTTAELAEAFPDPDGAALTLSDHLRVGILDEIDGPVVVASGKEYAVTVEGDDTVVGGRRIVRTVSATNGVIHLVDGLLGTED